VLSAEIIAITLGTVAGQDFMKQVAVLSAIAMIMTIGVYGLVACIVKLDDAGLYLTQRDGSFPKRVGSAILWAAPLLMKSLSVLGTAAMFLVGGGIVTHGIPWLHHHIEHCGEALRHVAVAGAALATLVPSLLNGLIGLLAGTLVLLGYTGIRKLLGKPAH
jgi:uncharacterized protein